LISNFLGDGREKEGGMMLEPPRLISYGRIYVYKGIIIFMKDSRYLQFQDVLRKNLVSLANIKGHDRLETRINAVTNWDGYMDILFQINVTRWFKDKNLNLIKQIEPALTHREGFGDILLTFLKEEIYCEATSLNSTRLSKKCDFDNKRVKNKHKKQPYLTKLEIGHEIINDRITRIILDKTKRQLPEDYPGIFAIGTGRAAVFLYDFKSIAKKVFINRPNIVSIMLWSLERGSDIGEAPFCFRNPNSKYPDIGGDLLKYLDANIIQT
jgi:hypothetical protein